MGGSFNRKPMQPTTGVNPFQGMTPNANGMYDMGGWTADPNLAKVPRGMGLIKPQGMPAQTPSFMGSNLGKLFGGVRWPSMR